MDIFEIKTNFQLKYIFLDIPNFLAYVINLIKLYKSANAYRRNNKRRIGYDDATNTPDLSRVKNRLKKKSQQRNKNLKNITVHP